MPENHKLGISLEPAIGYISGLTREIVYPSFNSVNPYLSELIWEIDNIFFAGGSLSFNYNNTLFLNGGIWFPFSKGSGEMNDYDWNYNNLQQWTHWSNHAIFLDESFLYNINTSFAFFRYYSFSISAILGFAQNYFYWTDKPNNYIYTSVDVDSTYTEGITPLYDNQGTFNVESGISYKILYSVPYLGLGIKYTNPYFILNALINYTFLSWAEDHDHHILRSLHFFDSFYNCSVLAAGINLKLYIARNTYVSISSIFEYIYETKGNTRIYNDSGAYLAKLDDSAGFQNYTISILSSIGFNF